MQLVISSNADTLVLPVAPDVSSVDVWGIAQDGLSGAWGGVAMRADEIDNPSGPGLLWPGRVEPSGRYLTITLAHRSNTSAVAEMEARDRIAGLLGHDLTVILDGPAGIRRVTGFVKSQPEFTHHDMRTCVCGMVVICPDPHWYGRPVRASGQWGGGTSGGGEEYPLYDGTGFDNYSGGQPLNRVRAANVGREPSWPTLTLDGQVSWARFTCGGQVVELQHPVDGLTVDCRAGQVLTGTTDVTGFLTRDDFFQIPAGGADVSFAASGPTGFTVEVSPAWL